MKCDNCMCHAEQLELFPEYIKQISEDLRIKQIIEMADEYDH